MFGVSGKSTPDFSRVLHTLVSYYDGQASYEKKVEGYLSRGP